MPQPHVDIAPEELVPGLTAAALLLVLCGACAPEPERTQTTVVDFEPAEHAFVGANVVPMTQPGLVLRDHTVLVRDGRITAVGPSTELDVPSEARRVDAAGRYLIPGLTDGHTHFEHFTSPEVLKLFVAHGVTTVRNMDGREYLLEWRAAVERGTMLGPRIYTAGPILDGDPPFRDDNTVVRNAAEADAIVAEQASAGYDFVKVYVNLSPDAYDAAVMAARSRGLPVAGHVLRRVPLEHVLASGQVSIEHVDAYDEWIEADDSPYRDGWHWSKLYLAMPVDTAKIGEAAHPSNGMRSCAPFDDHRFPGRHPSVSLLSCSWHRAPPPSRRKAGPRSMRMWPPPSAITRTIAARASSTPTVAMRRPRRCSRISPRGVRAMRRCSFASLAAMS